MVLVLGAERADGFLSARNATRIGTGRGETKVKKGLTKAEIGPLPHFGLNSQAISAPEGACGVHGD